MDVLTGEVGVEITLKTLPKKDFIIKSMGGDLWEGLAIHDHLKGCDITVGATGMVASSAIQILLGSKNRFGTPNSRYLIHNPSSIVGGDAGSMAKTANDLQIEQDSLVELYLNELNIPKDEIVEIMIAEKTLPAKEALRIGIITEIKNVGEELNFINAPYNLKFDTIKNKYIRESKDTKMDKEEHEEFKTQVAKTNGFLNKIMDKLGINSPKNIIIQDVNGVELNFGDTIQTKEQIVVDSQFTAGGEPANGEYILPTGETYKAENGVLIEIMEASQEPSETEALKEENTSLQNSISEKDSEIEALKATVAENKTVIDGFKNDLSEVQNQFNKIKNLASGEKQEEPTKDDKNLVKSTFTYKK